jgi:hypothetical protein
MQVQDGAYRPLLATTRLVRIPSHLFLPKLPFSEQRTATLRDSGQNSTVLSMELHRQVTSASLMYIYNMASYLSLTPWKHRFASEGKAHIFATGLTLDTLLLKDISIFLRAVTYNANAVHNVRSPEDVSLPQVSIE